MSRTLYKQNGIIVEQGHGVTELYLNGQLMGVMSTSTKDPVSPYMLHIINNLFVGKKERILVIGGGAYLIPSYYARKGCVVDVVEPLPEMDDIAIQYFGMISRGHKQIHRIYRDLAHIPVKKEYSIIILDAYDGPNPVEKLYSKENLDELKARCNVLIVNDTRRGLPYVYKGTN